MLDEKDTGTPSSGLREDAIAAEQHAKKARLAYIMSPEFSKNMSELFRHATKLAIEEGKQANDKATHSRGVK